MASGQKQPVSWSNRQLQGEQMTTPVFADEVKWAMQYAREEADRLGHRHIGTEHMLLGLVHTGTGGAIELLQRCGIGLGEVNVAVEELDDSKRESVRGDECFTIRAKTILEGAVKEAQELASEQVRPIHVLLALLRDPSAVAAQVLHTYGIDHDSARRAAAG